MLLAISFLLGAVHVLAPDHWVPLSLQVWQRSWDASRIRSVAAQFFLLHVLTGLLAALILSEWASSLGDDTLFGFSLAVVVGFAGFRFLRFSRLREAFLAGPQSKRGLLAAWSLLGPAESLIPVVLKSNQIGQGFWQPAAAYALGTLLAGTALVSIGRRIWNQPRLLAQAYAWVSRLSPLGRTPSAP
jgi:hypothetical protein